MDPDTKYNNKPTDKEDSFEEIEKPSYTYWKRESDKPDPNKFQPQKSQEGLGETQGNSNTKIIGSAWNTAGTWEEKHLNKNQLEDFLNNAISTKNKTFKDSFKITNLFSYSGDTYYVFIRGKIKFVYDCELKLKVEGINKFEESEGEITVREVTNHGLDDEFEFEYSFKDKSNLKEIARSNEREIEKFIKDLFEDLKESCLNAK